LLVRQYVSHAWAALGIDANGAKGGKDQGIGAIFFVCGGPNVDLNHVLCELKRCSEVQSRSRTPGQRSGGPSPPKAETLIAFGCAMKTANLPAL